MTSTLNPQSADLDGITTPDPGAIHHLRSAGVSVVIDARGPRLPRIVHWGADLGDLDPALLIDLAQADIQAVVTNVPDEPVQPGILTEHATGWPGLPGLLGHRGGRAWSALFAVVDVSVGADPDGTQRLVASARDDDAGLAVAIVVELSAQGLIRMRAQLTDLHTGRKLGETPYTLDGLVLSLPVPARAGELLDFAGRHLRERAPQRARFDVGARVRDNRRGRTGADATTLLIAGTDGFDAGSGEVWALHTAWSGNHRTIAERTPNGNSVLSGGELLLPGEIILAAGGSYTTPWIYGSYGAGLDAMSARFHQQLRARPAHPVSPRPVILNTWESVYFDHDLDRLLALAQRAAEVGAERYVLDDGWFLGRRSDNAGLGDWQVDPTIWPQGLHPLIDRVTELGMQFGLWVEPEMINLDSDLARAHPDWVMATGNRIPLSSRQQQVLDLANPGAYEHILQSLDALLTEYRIGYLKWDHNRDLIDAGHSPGGRAGVHDQTVAVYTLMDELRRRHPGVEIESCSSGGARVDLAVLEHTDRIWASDCIDALERQTIQRWTGLLVPPELLGAHVGSAHGHSTGRRHDLSFRAGIAFFGHMGIEMDLTAMTPQERDELAAWVTLHKRFRPLLHGGTVVRIDDVDPSLLVHGVVATDRREAVFSIATMRTADSAPIGRVVLRGLDPAAVYDVSLLSPGEVIRGNNHRLPPWVSSGVRMTGATLQHAGLQLPDLFPEQLLLLHVRTADSPSADTARREPAQPAAR
jgi:alpha-galactosidase